MTKNVNVHLDDLRLVNVSAIAKLYEKLGYTVANLKPVDLGLDILNAGTDAFVGTVKAVYQLVDMQGIEHWHVVLNTVKTADMRKVVQDFAKGNKMYLLSFSDVAYSEVYFVKPYSSEGVLKTSRLKIVTNKPTSHEYSVLVQMAVLNNASAVDIHKKQIDAFSVERVTEAFYKEYRKLFIYVCETIKQHNPDVQIGAYARLRSSDEKALHGFVQRMLGRIIFLYFIQKKKWLDGKADFVNVLYKEYEQTPNFNFYAEVLEPLFFEVLNTKRNNNASEFGTVPYLNGSLFEREYPIETLLDIPNSIFDPKQESSVLYLLNSYNFTLEESTTLEQEVSLDPEMLGKVFENMMEDKEASESGTFYTPRSIVQFLAEESLVRYVADKTAINLERLRVLYQDDQPEIDLSLEEANAVIAALQAVRVLDPAVGTASMLVGTLNTLVRMRRSAEAKRGVLVQEGSSALAEWKREYINNCLYGVDIKAEAIEIGRLRLWLSLVVDAQHPEPLPNLDYKLMAGDGLLESVDGTPFVKQAVGLLGNTEEISKLTDEITVLHSKFFKEQNPVLRLQYRSEIQSKEREIFRIEIDQRIEGLQADLRDPKKAKKAALNKAGLDTLQDQRKKVIEENEPLPFFLHKVHFADVMNTGGFDIVIGNPPYVRHEEIGKDYKKSLQVAFPNVGTGTADLSVYFYEKAYGLLKQGGQIAFITPNKFMRAGYGEKLRGFLSSETSIDVLVDFGDLPVFKAVVLVFIFIAKKEKSNLEDKLISVGETDIKKYISERGAVSSLVVREVLNAFHKFALGLGKVYSQKYLGKDGWVLENPAVMALIEKINKQGEPLGELVDGKFYRGIVTGFNEAFVIDKAKKDELIAKGPKSAEVIKPFLRGKDVKRWRADYKDLYLIFTRKGVNIEFYPEIKKHLESFKDSLMPKPVGHVGSWQGRKSGTYKWYEIQDDIAYYKEFEKPKLIYPEIAQSFSVLLDKVGLFANNKCFIIPEPPIYLHSILLSRLVSFWLYSYCPSLVGNAYEYRKIFMEKLPIVVPTPEQQDYLAQLTDDSRLEELNQFVYKLYNLTPAEIEIVEQSTQAAFDKIKTEE